jgi:hypothetical protein
MSDPESNEIQMNAANMFREETFTDNAVGTMRRLTPIDANGDTDPTRDAQYMGSTQVMTNAGPLPLNFEIPANSLAEAIEGFGEGAKTSFESTMQELQEMQRQQASSIVVPGAGGGGGMGGGMGGGGIQMP